MRNKRHIKEDNSILWLRRYAKIDRIYDFFEQKQNIPVIFDDLSIRSSIIIIFRQRR